MVRSIWSVTAKQDPLPVVESVIVKVFGSPVKSAAEGMYCAPMAVAEGVNVPEPVEVQVAPDATVNDPAKVAEAASAQIAWSTLAETVGAGVTVTTMLSVKAGQFAVGLEVAVNVKVVEVISAAVGV